MTVLLYVGVVVVGAGATAVLSLLELGDWKPTTKAPGLAAVAVLGAIAVAQAVRGAIRRYRIDRSEAFRRATSEALGAAFLQLLDLPDLSIKGIGISAWIVQRRLRKPWQKCLVRVGRLRLTSTPLPSRITWTRGKGVVGRCWELENIVAQETESLWRPHWQLDRRQWNGLHNGIRLRLRHREWRRIRGKYQGAVAVPIEDSQARFVGCISVDATVGTAWQALNCQAVVDIAAQAGATVANLLAMVNRWVYTTGT